MEQFLNSTIDFWSDNADARGTQWLLSSSIKPILIIITAYLFFIYLIIPSIFKSKKHEKFKNILAVYYIIHSLLSAWFACLCIYFMIKFQIETNYHLNLISVRCLPVVQTFEGVHYEIAVWAYVWLWFKVSEMLETFLVIIVYGKPKAFNVIHHSLHAFVLAVNMHFYLGGSAFTFVFFNNVEHAIYYMIVALRIISKKFKENSQSWFKEFDFLISIFTLTISFLLIVPLKLGTCEYETFNMFICLCILIFLCLSIHYERPRYGKKV